MLVFIRAPRTLYSSNNLLSVSDPRVLLSISWIWLKAKDRITAKVKVELGSLIKGLWITSGQVRSGQVRSGQARSDQGNIKESN